MKASKKSVFLIGVLIATCGLGYFAAHRMGFPFAGLELFIFVLIVIAAVYALLDEKRKQKNVAEGFPEEDEMSDLIKYRAGYQTFLVSMYVWLAMFLFQGWFKDHDTLFGVGVLLPAVIFIGIRTYLSRNPDENTH
jgi:uncharacterized membrane protein